MTSKHPYIKLVHSADSEKNETQNRELKVQYALFPEGNPYSIVCVVPSLLDETEFLDIFNEVHPRYVLDMRRVPRFDIGTLNREKMFSTYFSNELTYLDMENDIVSKKFSLISERFSEWLENFSKEFDSTDSFVGPVVIFIDNMCRDNPELYALADEIKEKTKTKKTWEVYSVN